MTTSTANTVQYQELVSMLNRFYAIGNQITDYTNLHSISNTVMNGICTEVKSTRGSRANTTHVAILALLANN